MTITPGPFRAELARLLGLDAKAIDYPYRVLRENGLVSKGGRGPSSAAVTPADAAMLLIAVVGGLPSQDVLGTVRAFRDLPAIDDGNFTTEPDGTFAGPASGGGWNLGPIPIRSLTELHPDHTFLDGLTALIAASADGSLKAALDSAPKIIGKGGYEAPRLHRISIDFFGPLPAANIRIAASAYSEAMGYRQPIPDDREGMMAWAADLERDPPGDLFQRRTVTGRTILPIGALLRGGMAGTSPAGGNSQSGASGVGGANG